MANYETPETFAAAVYTPKETDRSALTEFVAELKADEVKFGRYFLYQRDVKELPYVLAKNCQKCKFTRGGDRKGKDL